MLESTCSRPSGALHTLGAVRRAPGGLRCRPVPLRRARPTACCAPVRDPFGHQLMAKHDRNNAKKESALSLKKTHLSQENNRKNVLIVLWALLASLARSILLTQNLSLSIAPTSILWWPLSPTPPLTTKRR